MNEEQMRLQTRLDSEELEQAAQDYPELVNEAAHEYWRG